MAPMSEAAPSEDRALGRQYAKEVERQQGATLGIEDVSVSRNLSKEAVLKSLREHLRKLDSCCAADRGNIVLHPECLLTGLLTIPAGDFFGGWRLQLSAEGVGDKNRAAASRARARLHPDH